MLSEFCLAGAGPDIRALSKKKKKLSLFLDAAVGVWEFEVGNALAGWLEKTTASLLLLYYTYVRSLCKYIY